MRYTGELLFLWCERDDGYLLAYDIPSGAFEGRSLDELAAVTYHRATMEINTAQQGICPRCWGHTNASYPVDPDATQFHAAGDAVQARLVRDRCWLRYNVPLRAVVTSSPTVRSLLQRNGLNPVRAAITGQAGDTTLNWAVSVEKEDPVCASVRLELGTDQVVVDLDEDARTLDRRHSGRT